MVFDYTKGKKVVYVVMVYYRDYIDMRYFHYYREAKESFEKLCSRTNEETISISLYDMKKDYRKEYKRF